MPQIPDLGRTMPAGPAVVHAPEQWPGIYAALEQVRAAASPRRRRRQSQMPFDAFAAQFMADQDARIADMVGQRRAEIEGDGVPNADIVAANTAIRKQVQSMGKGFNRMLPIDEEQAELAEAGLAAARQRRGFKGTPGERRALANSVRTPQAQDMLDAMEATRQQRRQLAAQRVPRRFTIPMLQAQARQGGALNDPKMLDLILKARGQNFDEQNAMFNRRMALEKLGLDERTLQSLNDYRNTMANKPGSNPVMPLLSKILGLEGAERKQAIDDLVPTLRDFGVLPNLTPEQEVQEVEAEIINMEPAEAKQLIPRLVNDGQITPERGDELLQIVTGRPDASVRNPGGTMGGWMEHRPSGRAASFPARTARKAIKSLPAMGALIKAFAQMQDPRSNFELNSPSEMRERLSGLTGAPKHIGRFIRRQFQ
jgi:hypothetical protein